MKYTVIFVIIAAAVILGLKDPDGGRRDPVPADVIVAHSSHCAGCHGYDPSGIALTDADGADVNIYDDWRISMMGFSAYDPFWRATVRHETAQFPAAQSGIEQTCLKCHAPLGSQQYHYDGNTYAYAAMLGDSLGLDGVSCVACHQQPPETYGRTNSGNITLNEERKIYGPYENPFEGPMKLYVGFTPVFSDLFYSSGVCAGCHTLITNTLDENGTPTGNAFVEQATYHEWLNSTYAAHGTECQSCHIPLLEDSIVLAVDIKGLEKRSPFGIHQFSGANTAMLTLMHEHQDTLGLPVTSPESAWEESIGRNRASLRNAAKIIVNTSDVIGDSLYVGLSVVNQTGHKFPSGYPSRIAWLQVVLLDEENGDTLYANGILNADGRIRGRDQPYERHHEVAYSDDDVQIYEMVMSDQSGAVTTRLDAAYQPLKDNRLLPLGFKRSNPVYDTVAIWGAALDDPEYDSPVAPGKDEIEYRIPLNGNSGVADLIIALDYHTFPLRWMEDLFTDDSIPEVAMFKGMYDSYHGFHEVIDSVRIDGLSLESSSVHSLLTDEMILYPNPLFGPVIHVGGMIIPNTRYKLVSITGEEIQSGRLTSRIALDRPLPAGAYFMMIIFTSGETRIHRLVSMGD